MEGDKEKKKKSMLRPWQAGSSLPGMVLSPLLTPAPNASVSALKNNICPANKLCHTSHEQASPASTESKNHSSTDSHGEDSSWYLNSRDLINLQTEELQIAPSYQQQVMMEPTESKGKGGSFPMYFKMVISKPRLKNGHEDYNCHICL